MYRHKFKGLVVMFCIAQIVLTLLFFKYVNHINILGISDILMPLGISYYSFKMISYILDIYYDRLGGNHSLHDYFIYVAFFPQIICGPISRADELLKQIENIKRVTGKQMETGIYLIILGLFKKVVIADRMSEYVNLIFADYANYPALALWLAAFLYTIEIYCDFAGYSEISIGICYLMGIEIRPNFLFPYFSESISEFWRRWHISLSSWLRDYVYIPLGGSKKGSFRKYLNTIIVFIVSGIWHGEGIHFILWGLWHAMWNVIKPIKSNKSFKKWANRFLTFVVAMLGWIMFKVDSVRSGFDYILCMFRSLRINAAVLTEAILPFTSDYAALSYFIITIAVVILLFVGEYKDYKKYDIKNNGHTYTNLSPDYGRMVVYICIIILIGKWGQNGFIYGNF